MSPRSERSRKRPFPELKSHKCDDNANHLAASGLTNLSSYSPRLPLRKKQCLGTGVRGGGEKKSCHEEAQSSVPIPLLRSFPSKDSREHSCEDWELHKSMIQRLYVVEKRKLREVIEIMNRDYNFAATQRQFKRKISKWGFDKNIKSHEMEAIVRKRMWRMVTERKESGFRLRGVPVEEAKINRYLRGKEPSFPTIQMPSPVIATPSALSCYTPTECSTPSPTQKPFNIESIHNSLASLVRKMARQSTSRSSQSSEQLTFSPRERSVSPVTSGYSPHLNIPFHVFDDPSFLSKRLKIAPQRIIYILCAIASASGEEIISGESWRSIDHVDQVISLRCEDTNSAAVRYQATSSTIVETSFGWCFGENAMENYLTGIYNLLRTTHRLVTNKGEDISATSPQDCIRITDSWRPPSLEEQYLGFVPGFDPGVEDPVLNSTDSLPPFNEELMDIDITPWCLGNASTDASFANEQEHWNLRFLQNSSDSELSSSLPFNSHETLSDPVYRVQKRRDSDRLNTFTISKPTAFGKLDMILQVQSPYSDLKYATGHDNSILENLLAASIIITPLEHSIAARQAIFKLTRKSCFESLLMSGLSFRHTLPYLSEVFGVAEFGTPRELEVMLHEGRASLNDCDLDGRSLLNYALSMRNVEMCKFLLNTGADVNAFEPGIACLRCPMLSLLSNFDYCSDRNKTPACFQLMLEAGADPSLLVSTHENMFCSVFSVVLPIANLHTLKLLLDLENPFITSNSSGDSELEYPPILILAGSCYEDVGFYDTANKFVLLIQRSADIHARDADGKTCLHILMEHGGPTNREQMYDVLMVLLTAGADIYATTKYGQTVSYFAWKSGYLGLWRQVLEECGYNIRPIPLLSRNHYDSHTPHEEIYLHQRCRLSFEEYCRRRSLSTRFEELDSDDDEGHGNEDYDTVEYDEGLGDRENESRACEYAESDYEKNSDESVGMDITNGENCGNESRLQENGGGKPLEHGMDNEEQDFRKLFYLDKWDLMEY